MSDDIRDPLVAEALAVEAEDELLRRREFLERTAVAAGLTATLGAALSPDTVVAAAADRQRRRRLPAPRNLPIDTFVVLMMENRSFDHYLGWMPNADGRQAGLHYTDDEGRRFATRHLTGDFQGCAFEDPDHSWEGGRQQLHHGKVDGFLRGDNDIFAISYYKAADLPFLPHVARAYTTFDRFFCSLLGPTYPNRHYMHAAQSYGIKENVLRTDLPDSTIFAALKRKGVSSRYFYSDLPVSAFWGQKGLDRSARVDEYYERCATGKLPALSFVDPAFVGESAGTSGDEHPHGDVRTGQAFMADVVHAFMESPQFKRGALFIVYDEWGGFFDHVRPPHVPDVRGSRRLSRDFGQMGFRIPAVAVSPYARRRHVDHGVYGFESILKLIRYRFGLASLTRRDARARNIGLAFDFDRRPRLDPPDLPRPPHIVSAACAPPPAPAAPPAPGVPAPGTPPGARVAAAPARPKEHDLAALHTSGALERLGFEYRPATAATVFREPSSMGLA
jgi:phospholipase C